jgi:hypothetical protein
MADKVYCRDTLRYQNVDTREVPPQSEHKMLVN